MPEAADSITAGQVKPLLSEVRHIHAGPLHPDDIESQALALMAESKKLVSLDVPGLSRRTENWRILPPCQLVSSGIALGPHHQGRRGGADPHARSLSRKPPGFLLRFGSTRPLSPGARAAHQCVDPRRRGYHFGAETVRRPVSTVGAGDVFFAAYLVAHVYRKLDIDVAAMFAAGVAAKQVSGKHLAPELLDLTGEFGKQGGKGKKKQGERSAKGGKEIMKVLILYFSRTK